MFLDKLGQPTKALRTKLKQNEEAIKAGRTKKRYKGLDVPPKFVSRTCTLNYQRDYSFTKDSQVGITTTTGRIKVNYKGYSKHLEMIQARVAKIGGTQIRERTKPRRKGKKASNKQRRANSNKARWSFAELHGFIDYKAVLKGSLAVKVDAHYTSQACPCCGHTSKENRPNKGLTFVCQPCGYTLHADLVGARNVALRVLLSRQRVGEYGASFSRP
jgi:predicted RNA-binding Zn-ribbon protein involved in translation (DUF1610 family)